MLSSTDARRLALICIICIFLYRAIQFNIFYQNNSSETSFTDSPSEYISNPGLQAQTPSSEVMQEMDINIWKQKLVGKRYVPGKAPVAYVEGNVVYESQLPSLKRIVAPDSMLTMDYLPNRLNVNVDDNNVIQSVRFG